MSVGGLLGLQLEAILCLFVCLFVGLFFCLLLLLLFFSSSRSSFSGSAPISVAMPTVFTNKNTPLEPWVSLKSCNVVSIEGLG